MIRFSITKEKKDKFGFHKWSGLSGVLETIGLKDIPSKYRNSVFQEINLNSVKVQISLGKEAQESL